MAFLSAFSNFLTGPVGNGLQNTPQNIRTTKRNLKRSGFFDDETENDFITADMEKSIRRFQQARDLKEDGKLFPGGETERELFRTLERRDPKPFFRPAVDKGDHVGFGGNVTGTLAYKPRNHDQPSSELPAQKLRIGLLGEAGGNQPTDVLGARPEIRSSQSQILNSATNKEVMDAITLEEGDPRENNHMFQDTAKHVTVAGGVLLYTVEDAKKLPFMIRDESGGWRDAEPDEIERAYNKAKAVQATNVPAAHFKPGTEFARTHGLEDMKLPADVAMRKMEKHALLSAKRLRRKFPDFDSFPKSAQQALLDLEFNLGIKLHNKKDKAYVEKHGIPWKNLYAAIHDRDWIRAANESSRVTEGHTGMASRNQRTREKFLNAAKEE